MSDDMSGGVPVLRARGLTLRYRAPTPPCSRT